MPAARRRRSSPSCSPARSPICARSKRAASRSMPRARMIYFRLAADADQFLTIAKFRALRKLWARVEQACGLAPEAGLCRGRDRVAHDDAARSVREHVALHHRGRSPPASAARTRSRCCRSPPRSACPTVSRAASRATRSSSCWRKSNLAKVADPAAGSGGIEDLTQQLCAAAWALFQEIEQAGGAWRGARSRADPATRSRRCAPNARRTSRGARDALTGTSEFPDLARSAGARCSTCAPPSPAPAGAADHVRSPAAHPPRGAVRGVARRVRPRAGRRPARGQESSSPISARSSDFTARATVRQEFLRGRRDRGGDERRVCRAATTMVAAFKTSGAELACLCSSDEVYARGSRTPRRRSRRPAHGIFISPGRPGELRGRVEGCRRAGLHLRRLRRRWRRSKRHMR